MRECLQAATGLGMVCFFFPVLGVDHGVGNGCAQAVQVLFFFCGPHALHSLPSYSGKNESGLQLIRAQPY